VLLAIGAIPDNFLQSIAGVLMIASTVWIAVAAGRRGAPASMAFEHAITPHFPVRAYRQSWNLPVCRRGSPPC
jgi:hypothetical protein